MSRTRPALVSLALVACSGSSQPAILPVTQAATPPQVDPCEPLFEKLRPTPALDKPTQRAAFLELCRRDVGAAGSIAACVKTAADLDAVTSCVMAAPLSRRMRSEPSLQLKRLLRAVLEVRADLGVFPNAETPLTPTAACCTQPDKACVSDAAVWSDPLWQELRFTLTEPSQFQYSYEGTPEQFTLEAVGDLDCDGVTVTYRLTGGADDDGVIVELDEPHPSRD